IDYGVVFLLAALALVAFWPRREMDETDGSAAKPNPAFGDRKLLLTWICTIVLWSYAPVSVQNRFLLGIEPALSVYAAIGWQVACRALASRLQEKGMTGRRAATIAGRLVTITALTFASGTILVIFTSVVMASATDAPSAQYR